VEVVLKGPPTTEGGASNSNMKVVVVLFAFYFLGNQQVPNYLSFSIHNKEVVWEQVYHDDINPEQLSESLFNHLKSKVWIKDLRYDGEDIVGELANYRPDYKRYGGKFRNTATAIRTGKWDGKVRISFKEGKYRVILEGLHYEAQQAATGSGKATIEQHEISGMLTQWALNNYRDSFRKNRLSNLDILHVSFKDSFTLVADQLIDSDW